GPAEDRLRPRLLRFRPCSEIPDRRRARGGGQSSRLAHLCPRDGGEPRANPAPAQSASLLCGPSGEDSRFNIIHIVRFKFGSQAPSQEPFDAFKHHRGSAPSSNGSPFGSRCLLMNAFLALNTLQKDWTTKPPSTV